MARIIRCLLSCMFMINASILAAEDFNGNVISAVAPVFPFDCYLTKTSGKIKLQLTIDHEGNVTNVLAIESSAPFLAADSINAARQWKFSKGSEITSSRSFNITFYFRVMPDSTPKEELTAIYRLPFEMEIRSKGKPSFHDEVPAATHD